MNKIISHLKKTDGQTWEVQTNEEHSQGVADLAQGFAAKFGMAEWGKVLGLLHDKGKETDVFQKYIRITSGMEPGYWKNKKPYHAYVGAILSKLIYKDMWIFIANAIAGHHRGLYNRTPLTELLKNPLPTEISTNIESIHLKLPLVKNPQDGLHIPRMLFSCLVDADYLDTERFMNPSNFELRGKSDSISTLIDKLENYLTNLSKQTPQSPINDIRNEIQKYARAKGISPKGLFELTVPTGGGKTLSSVLWALYHARHNNQDRIIIAIPYTSIIEQTADTLKKIFGVENVLEHHSLVNHGDIKDPQLADRLKAATENWDYPIIVTTNVRLFESMFSHKSSSCRRLHNIANSVVILDEVQSLQFKYYTPILSAINAYSRLFGTSWLFMSASQPVLSKPSLTAAGRQQFTPLYISPERLLPYNEERWLPLRRVNLTFDNTPRSYEELATQLDSLPRVLCIVNTRRVAAEIFKSMTDSTDNFHLSRLMCPAHIKQTLKEIKTRLKDSTANVRVVATQLIEAGVDVDFPVVYRQTIGLDSIIQAAGRCNREGLLAYKGDMTVFSLIAPEAMPTGLMKHGYEVFSDLAETATDLDWFTQTAMDKYFQKLYHRIQDFDEDGIMKELNSINYETASIKFKLIKDASTSVVVNWEKSTELIEKLRNDGPSYALYLALTQYSVGLHDTALQELKDMGVIEEIYGILFLTDPRCYDKKRGIIAINQNLEDPLIVG